MNIDTIQLAIARLDETQMPHGELFQALTRFCLCGSLFWKCSVSVSAAHISTSFLWQDACVSWFIEKGPQLWWICLSCFTPQVLNMQVPLLSQSSFGMVTAEESNLSCCVSSMYGCSVECSYSLMVEEVLYMERKSSIEKMKPGQQFLLDMDFRTRAPSSFILNPSHSISHPQTEPE